MTPYLQTERATLYHAKAEDVYPILELGSVSMVWSDGPYGILKADWDRMGIDGLADWYAPHIEAWGRVCAPSATVYLWGTAEGWARIDPVMRAAGWRFRALIVWYKTGANPALISAKTCSKWPDLTEVCGCYTRGEPVFNAPGIGNVWPLAPIADMATERLKSGNLTTRTFGARLCEEPLHPCQKPLLFADRAARASTRIGDTILDPFAGTNRIALACRRLPEEERRHAIGIEMDQRWLDAVRPSLIADHTHTGHSKQPSLFRSTP